MSFLTIFSIAQAVIGAFAAAAGPAADGTGGIISLQVQHILYALLGITVPGTVAVHAVMTNATDDKANAAVKVTASLPANLVPNLVAHDEVRAFASALPPTPRTGKVESLREKEYNAKR
jgi:hypothetical protein